MGKRIIVLVWKSKLIIFIRKIINTFRFMANISGFIKGRKKLRDNDARVWLDENHYQSDFYKELDEESQRFIDYVRVNTSVGDSILDICCNQGRFLYALKSEGYNSLYGFDVMAAAIAKLKQNNQFDENVLHIKKCLAQEYFVDVPDNHFDWAITYTATIELIHPEFDIFFELGRTVKKGMFLVLSESGHTYPRFYKLLHKMNGFDIVSVTDYGNGCVLIHSSKCSNDMEK